MQSDRMDGTKKVAAYLMLMSGPISTSAAGEARRQRCPESEWRVRTIVQSVVKIQMAKKVL